VKRRTIAEWQQNVVDELEETEAAAREQLADDSLTADQRRLLKDLLNHLSELRAEAERGLAARMVRQTTRSCPAAAGGLRR